ncbi:FixH family protein [Bacillus shivajii]|uniref:FixH family protein n=1 Tax=Bacillus shivajii TaxID=1983719 RepID=UPI001CF9938F|nr:FixH family protein [Bacillus shivajii]UCZ52585.1 FixH family protein [Bacillus shivajii]
MKKIYVLLLALCVIFLTACGGEEDDQSGNVVINTDPLEVEVLMSEQKNPDEEILLSALVTQGEEPVNDADEVIFEVWQEGQKEESDMVDYTEVDEGVYVAPYTFKEEAVYFVQPHVTARGMHVMPVHEVAVGDVDLTGKYDEGGHDHDHDHDTHDHEEHGHHHHSDIIDVNANFEHITRENNQFELEVLKEGEPLTEARVQLEIWQHGDETRTWHELMEEAEGVYTATHHFEESGEFHVVIHIENDDLHEHLDDSFTIDE